MRTHRQAVRLVRRTAKEKLLNNKAGKLANITVVESVESDVGAALNAQGFPENILSARKIRNIIEDEMVAYGWTPKVPRGAIYLTRLMQIALLIPLCTLWVGVFAGYARSELDIITAIVTTPLILFSICIGQYMLKLFKRMSLFPIPA